jgi:ribosome maturation factor RimP
MSQIDKSIEKLLDNIANDLGFYIVKISVLNLRNNAMEVMIDRFDENKITILDCKTYNAKLKEHHADFVKILGDEYYFDISSPGVERPLVKILDYERFKNNIIIVKLKEKIYNKKKIQGKLMGVEDNQIKIEVNNEMILIDYDKIQNANIVMTEEIFRKLLSK